MLHVEPSGDESIPPESLDAPLHLPTYFSPPLSGLNPRLAAQSMKRPRETLESGSTKGPRAERMNPRQDEETASKQYSPEAH